MAKLTIDDIADQRAYERERDAFRRHVIALKKRRRVGVGPFVTLVFENRDTVRFQIQEMARVERIGTDEGIQEELDVYNPLVPEPGHLAASLFIELTDDDAMRRWLPELVGIETSVELRLSAAGDGDGAVARCQVDPAHASQLTRDEITAAVHYVHFSLTPEQVDAVEAGPVRLAVAHPAYDEETMLGDETRAELLADLRGT
ncbi:MAG TPA: DUF3501 family protein [Acidimicrobiales bacterium]|nr:DUF3501 family protein [Acidimicrobiales bacterium]